MQHHSSMTLHVNCILGNITEFFTADAASDEQLAGQMMRSRDGDISKREMYGPFLSNLKVVQRDKPHAARRIHRLVNGVIQVF